MVRLKLKDAKLEVGWKQAQVDKYSFKLSQTTFNKNLFVTPPNHLHANTNFINFLLTPPPDQVFRWIGMFGPPPMKSAWSVTKIFITFTNFSFYHFHSFLLCIECVLEDWVIEKPILINQCSAQMAIQLAGLPPRWIHFWDWNSEWEFSWLHPYWTGLKEPLLLGLGVT